MDDQLIEDQKRAAWLVEYAKSIGGGESQIFDAAIAKLLLISALAYDRDAKDPNDLELNRYADSLIDAVYSTNALDCLKSLQDRIGLGFHPDTQIGDYIVIGSFKETPDPFCNIFPPSEVAELERKRLEAVHILTDAGIAFYSILLERVHNATEKR